MQITQSLGEKFTAVLVGASILCLGVGSTTAAASTFEVSASSVVASPVTKLKQGDFIGKLYVPRYGKKYLRTILEGTAMSILNNKAGLGHYVETQLPGQEGNFAIAGHRAGNGGPMLKIDKLKKGDLAFVQTKTSWFSYRYLATKVVKPSNVGVIYPVPVGLAGSAVGGHYMTFTSCTPVHVNTNRIAAWFEFVEETPVADGMPAALKATR